MGAAENDLLGAFANVKNVDGDGSISLVKAAQAAGVQQFVMVTSLGTGKWGWPAGAASALRSDRRADQAMGISDRRADQIDRQCFAKWSESRSSDWHN